MWGDKNKKLGVKGDVNVAHQNFQPSKLYFKKKLTKFQNSAVVICCCFKLPLS